MIISWLIGIVALSAGAIGISKPFSDGFSVPGTESQDAIELIEARTPGADADAASGRVVFAAPEGQSLGSGAGRSAVEQAIGAIGQVPGVAEVSDPYTSEAVSTDGATAYADVDFAIPAGEIATEQTDGVAAAVQPAQDAGLRVEVGGDAAAAPAEAPIGEVLGIVVAALVLTITFGSVIAAGLPLLTAALGVAVGIMGALAATAFTDLDSNTTTLTLMLGLAVGIDYALLVLTRHRAQVRAGMDIGPSIAKAVATAGSAVVFAGTTVVIALVALLVTGIPLLQQMGLATAFTVAVAVAVNLTLVPALMAVMGRRAVRGKVFLETDSAAAAARPTLGARWIGLVVKRRIVAIVIPVVALGALAVPALDMELALPGDAALSPESTQRQAYDLLSEGFGPGFNGPLTVATVLPTGVGGEAAAAEVATQLGRVDGVAAVSPPQLNPEGDLALIQVVPTTGPTDPATTDLVRSIRDAAGGIESATGTEVLVTGQTAVEIDASQKMADALIPYLAVIVGLALLVLLLAFRSVLVPLTALAGFLLTIAATFGAVVSVFQNGHAAGLLGVDQTGPLASILPVVMIGVLFGLAMDYQIFLVSRMREEVRRGATPVDAVRDGFRHGARVVTAAALIMTAVFSGFMIPDDPIIKSVGFAFALGVLIDAFVVRMTLIPALMLLMGRRAWYLPRWLDRALPEVDLDGAAMDAGPSSEQPPREAVLAAAGSATAETSPETGGGSRDQARG
ncbi:MMPL family transporter [Modestobacter versicolor]|uniref:RND superfamily putative drug exporter n=1 Tax=Modestobacter versicolor TaxID=429133 RepID=A0A839Y0C6_9ACTN|nr:MMPL family transporter [Modestobacter versicolor]MBB3674696.1 RND superfamily putative drug exporter [Modestobacter versicolor]